jgi:lipid-binding SYLF domain-containing protein
VSTAPAAMSRSMRRRLAVLLTALCLAHGGCALKAIPRADLDQSKVTEVRSALDEFRRDERLAPYFEGAEIIAVYPFTARAASGVGGAYGRGLVFDRSGRPIGHSRMWQISGGPQLGGQIYRQVLFFRSREAYEALGRGPAEFAGQFNAAAAVIGVSATPSFNADVALFTQLRGGLLLEASVSAHRYDFGPITD